MRTFSKSFVKKLQCAALAIVLTGLSFGALTNLNEQPQVAVASLLNGQSITANPGHRTSDSVRSQVYSQQNSQSQTTGAAGSTTTAYYYNWSGYAATAANPFVEAQSTFVQPTVTCTTPGAWTLFWVGFDGYTNGTVEQAGTAAQCSTGSRPQPTYYAWWEMYPTNNIQTMPITIKAGDTVQATATYTASNGEYSLNVSDLTNTRQQYTELAKCAANLVCARQSAEWIVERPTLNGAYTPLADWATMKLTSDKAADTTTAVTRFNRVATPVMQPMSAFTNTPIDMVNDPDTGETLASVGSLDKTGTIFSDTWQAAQ